MPTPWGLDRQLSPLEKGFSVEAELAVLKLALWLARRPSEVICAPSCQAGAILGAGVIAHTGAKRSHFLHSAVQAPFVYEDHSCPNQFSI